MSDAVIKKTSLPQRIYEYIDSKTNAVMIKDMRISLRSKRFIGLFFFGLFVAQYTTVTLTAFADEQGSNPGKNLFIPLIIGMAFVLSGILPFITHSRFSEEMRSRSTELVMGSGLTPGELVRGKIYCSILLAMLFFAAVGPSFVIAYLLGGISILLVFYLSLILLLLSFATNIIAVLLVSISLKRKTTIVGLGLFILGFIVSGIIGGICSDITRRNSINKPEFWAINLVIILLSVAALIYFYIIAVKRLSFESDNRDYAPRLTLLIITIFSFLVVGFGLMLTVTLLKTVPLSVYDFFMFGTLAAIITFTTGLLFTLNTPNHPSNRVYSEWSKSRIKGFLLQPGEGRLYLYTLTVYLVLFVASIIIDTTCPRIHILLNIVVLAAASFYFSGFVFHTILLKFFKKLKPVLTRGISVFIWNAVWAAVNLGLISFFGAFRMRSSVKYAVASNPITTFFAYLDRSPSDKYLVIAYLVHGTTIIVSLLFLAGKIAKDFSESKKLRLDQLSETDKTLNDS